MARRRSSWTVGLLALVAGGLAIPAASATSEAAGSTEARATVKVAQSKYGRILVDGRGRTLYLFTSDSPGQIACTSDFMGCTKLWPPLFSQGKPRAGAGVNTRLLATVRRTKPAGMQVTYKRHPLYYFADDKKPGDTLGQAYFGIWYVVSPKGTAIRKT